MFGDLEANATGCEVIEDKEKTLLVAADELWRRQLEHCGELTHALQSKRDEVRAGWGKKYKERVHAKGKLTTWERIERLKDDDSPILPVGTLVNYGRTFGTDRRSPGRTPISPMVPPLRRPRKCG